MNRLVLIAMCFIALTVHGINKDFPVIQYMKDGGTDIYSTQKIDSITFSHLDLDSVWHPEIVVQEIWCGGMGSRALIKEIEKVKICSHDTVLKPDVYDIGNELAEYVNSFDLENFDLYIYDYCPKEHLPKVGDKLYYLEMNNVFPFGFMGEVDEIEAKLMTDGSDVIKLKCHPVDYEDIFESFYGKYDKTIYGNHNHIDGRTGEQSYLHTRKLSAESKITNTIPSFDYTLPLYFDNMSISGFNLNSTQTINVGFVPKVDVTNLVYVENGKKVRNCFINAELTINAKGDFRGSASLNHNIELFKRDVPIPVAPFLSLYAETGIYSGIAVTDSEFSAEMSRRFKVFTNCSFDGTKIRDFSFGSSVDKTTPLFTDIFASGKGNLNLGIYVELGVESIIEAFWDKVDKHKESTAGKVNVSFQGGLRFNLDAQYTKDEWDSSEQDTRLYDKLTQPDNVSVGIFGGTGAEASLLKLSISEGVDFETTPFWRKPLLPKFTELKTENPAGSFAFKVHASYDPGLLNPQLGLVAFDKSDMSVKDSYNLGEAKQESSTKTGIIGKPVDDETLRIHPYMQYQGKKILANPYVEYQNSDGPMIEDIVTDCYFTLQWNHNDKLVETALVNCDIILNDIGENCCRICFNLFGKHFEFEDLSNYRDNNCKDKIVLPINIDITSYRYELSQNLKIINGEYIFKMPFELRLYFVQSSSEFIQPTGLTNYITIQQDFELRFRPKFSINNITIDKNPYYPDYSDVPFIISADFETEGLMCYYLSDPKTQLTTLLEFMGEITDINDPSFKWTKDYLDFISGYGYEKWVPFAIVKDGHSSKTDTFYITGGIDGLDLVSSTPSTYGPTNIYRGTATWGLGQWSPVELINRWGYHTSFGEFFPSYQYVKFDCERTMYYTSKNSYTCSDFRIMNIVVANSK